jgi:hypothetical protein
MARNGSLHEARNRTKPSASRRTFLKQAAATALASSLTRTALALATPINTPAVVKNRAPLAPNAFYLLPLGAVRPTGWLHSQLQIQAGGLTGHLGESWPDVGPNSGWLGGTGESWERGPYYLDGLVPLAWLLDDARLKTIAQSFLDWTLNHQQPNGMLGPGTTNDWWPRMVMLKALTQYYEVSADPRVLPALTRYFALQLRTLPGRPLQDWGKFRWQDNALTALWLYNRTGDEWLLDLVRLLHAQGHDWQAQFSDFKYTERVTPEAIKLKQNGLNDIALATHGVNNGQAIKAGPVWSMLSSVPADRLAATQMLTTLDRFHGLPNGMFSCDEHFAGRNPSQGSELCTVVETMFSLEQSLAVTGEVSLGDRLERLAFNALPGTLTDDMWSHQYDQEPNQVECSLHHKPWTTDGPESNLFGLDPNFGCCTANYHQGWPKFTTSLWMASHDDGLAAVAYAPSAVHTSIRGVVVECIEDTGYPFEPTIRITVNPASTIAFPLHLRIPAWAQGAQLRINGELQTAAVANTFARIDRTWMPGDFVELTLPLIPRLTPGFNDSVSIDRGPLVFSLPIGESWVKLRDRGLTADWQVFPTTRWNYALSTSTSDIASIRVHAGPVTSAPFSLKTTPVTLEIRARKLDTWQAVDGVAEPVPQSPVSTGAPDETIKLVPYAAAKLRITSFPQCAPTPLKT